MNKIELIPIRSTKIIEKDTDIIEVILESLKEANIKLQNNDILVIASKVIATAEGRMIKLDEVKYSKKAEKLAKRAHIPPAFAEIILNECDNNVIGVVPGAITTINRYGLLANAGADQSNAGENRVITLPKNIKKSAKEFHEALRDRLNSYVGIIIADSRTMPLRLGTVGCALGTYGFEPIIDERGKEDLFNRPMHITVRALADQIATAAELLMGETNEQIPFVIVRGINIKRIPETEEKDINNLIKPDQCMFLGPLLPKKLLKKLKKKTNVGGNNGY